MIKFIIQSYSFKWILVISVFFVLILAGSGYFFDVIWGSPTSIPIINLKDVYKPPVIYDNYPRVNLKLTGNDRLCVEGNLKFKIEGSSKNNEYYDTIVYKYPETTDEYKTTIFIRFEDSPRLDSIILVVSKSPDPKMFYKQIFYSTIIVNELNNTSKNPEIFRINKLEILPQELLEDNDSLINKVFKYFNDNKDKLGLAECGTNSEIFKSICAKFNLPCRVVSLQGGNADQLGYNNTIGYPLHVVCEIYSSKHKKWYVVDPSYGFRFRQEKTLDYLNAVEISNMYEFFREREIIQDSVLFTKRTVVGRDYFRYYENIFYVIGTENRVIRKIFRILFPKFNYRTYHFSNNYPPVNNGLYYIGVKTFMYFFLLIVYINSAMFILIKRLFGVKKPKGNK